MSMQPYNGIVIIPPYRALLLAQTKVASTSLAYTAAKLAGHTISERGDGPARHRFKTEIPGFDKMAVYALTDHFRFGFVRNPWARLLSAYVFAFADSREKGLVALPHWFQQDGRFRLEMTFDDFVEVVAHSEDALLDVHLRSQCSFFRDDAGRWLPDFLGRIERVSEDWQHICQRAGFPDIELPFLNRTKHGHYTQYYGPRARELVARRYAEDVERFNYRF